MLLAHGERCQIQRSRRCITSGTVYCRRGRLGRNSGSEGYTRQPLVSKATREGEQGRIHPGTRERVPLAGRALRGGSDERSKRNHKHRFSAAVLVIFPTSHHCRRRPQAADRQLGRPLLPCSFSPVAFETSRPAPTSARVAPIQALRSTTRVGTRHAVTISGAEAVARLATSKPNSSVNLRRSCQSVYS